MNETSMDISIMDFESAAADDADDNEKNSYQVISSEQIVDTLKSAIEDITGVFDLPATTARILLSHLKWDKQKLMEKLCDEDNRDGFFAGAHVIDPQKKGTTKRIHWNTKVECKICYSRLAIRLMVGVDCGHKFCKDCWQQYLTLKICDEGAAEAINCPESGCDIVVDDVTVMDSVAEADIRKKYQHLMTSSFVEHNKLLRWCPGPGCSYAVKVDHIPMTPLPITCKCGFKFCFDCGDKVHVPVPCKLLKLWRQSDNEETMDWLIKSTKPCPNCSTAIEKNGGCNHMSCRKCGYEFCWLCFGTWKSHTVNISGMCNRFVDKGIVGDEAKKKLKFRHYFERYANHRDSKTKLEDLDGSIEDNQRKMLNDFKMSWIDTQFLPEAQKTLLACRDQLMYSYIFAYYAADSHQKIIFQDNQSNLETAVEKLTHELEAEITHNNFQEIETKVKDQARYCEQRLKALQKHIEDEYWSFITN